MDKIDLKKIKNISLQMIGGKLAEFWNRFFKLFSALFFLAMVAAGGYFWYFNLYQPNWSEEEKNNFINSQSKETELKTDVLEKVTQRINARREKFNQETFNAKNIFKAY